MGAETEACFLLSRAYQPVVIRVGADPNPNHLLARSPAKGAIVISDANAEAIFASLQTPETERGIMRVPSPKGNARKSSQNRRVPTDFTLEAAIHEEGPSPIHFQLRQIGNRACPQRSRHPVARPIAFVRAPETIGRCAGGLPGAGHR